MEKLGELYSRNVEASLNAVVSTGDTTDQTVQTEINEYVFTDDIVNGLYRTLEAIKNGSTSHNGVWVSGYFGSGKSHFLKYVSYCLRNMGNAISRMTDAVKESLAGDNLGVVPLEWAGVADWLVQHAASVKTILFNMGESGDFNAKEGEEFLTVFWRKFNEMRGYSGVNLPLAYFLERPLDKVGKFDDFKAKIAEKGYNWENDRSDLAGMSLDTVLMVAKDTMPELTVDAVRENIIHNRVVLSVSNFMEDVNEWILAQDPDCRLVFCVDEISQYINNRVQLLLQLQEIVTAFHNKCGEKVWLVCTAQQDLSEITSASGIGAASAGYGKIMGRFPIMVQLSASSTEFITRKRVLAKTASAAIELGHFYDEQKDKINHSQYVFPAAYPVYADRDDFIATYPFLGCHFRLMGQVLRAFRDRNFVVQNVKDNARSVLTLTLDVAKVTRNCQIGKFIAFDEFFSWNLKTGLTARANSVIQNARELIKQRENPAFAERVLNVLFMICHLDYQDAQTFPATIDNLTSLLMTDLSTSRKTLREQIEAEVSWLCEKSVLMRETTKAGTDHFKFYSKTESEIDCQIKGITPGLGDLASIWENLISERLGSALKPKVTFHATKVSVGMDILGRHLLSGNADVNIDLRINSGGMSLGQFRLGNHDTTLAFFVNDLCNADTKFRDALDSYCRFDLFSKHNAPNSPEEKAAFEVFRDRAKRLRSDRLIPGMEKFLLEAPIISGQNDISTSPTSNPAKRFEEALQKHLEILYPKAQAAENLPHTAVTLSADITGWHAPLPGTSLAGAERIVEGYLSGLSSPYPIASVVDYFQKRPYGWDEYATLAVLNRLVVSEHRQFIYNGSPNPSRETVAANLAKNTANFSIVTKAAIPKETIDAFLGAMRKLFGHTTLHNASQQTSELVAQAKEFLSGKTERIHTVKGKTGPRPFIATPDAVCTKFSAWEQIVDVPAFFAQVTDEAPSLTADWDTTKQAMGFVEGTQWDKYLDILRFVSQNTENALFLSGADKEKFGYLVAAKDDTQPWNSLPSWIQIKKQLEAAFEECRQEKRAAIEEVYTFVFNELAEIAESLGVAESPVAFGAETIAEKQKSDSLMALENAINSAQAFKDRKMREIIAAQPSAPSAKHVKSVKLAVSHATPLKNEAEVDADLRALKRKLMAEIDGGFAIVIQ